MDIVQKYKKKIYNEKFRDIEKKEYKIDSFHNLFFIKKDESKNLKKNQLFSNESPPYELVEKIFESLLNIKLNETLLYNFSRKILLNKNVNENIIDFIPELKKYYLKCKHQKYLENLNEKKIITIFRQILKDYDYTIKASEKYENGTKYLLYTIEKKKIILLKKINSIINFD
jgi:hypothetical protein